MRTVDFWLTRLIFCNTYYFTVLIGLVVSVWVGQGYVLLNPVRHYYRPESPIYIPYIYRSYSQAVYPEAFMMCCYDTTYPSWLRYTTLTSYLGFDRPQLGRSELPAIGALPMSKMPTVIDYCLTLPLSWSWPPPQSGRSELSAIGALHIPFTCLIVLTIITFTYMSWF